MGEVIAKLEYILSDEDGFFVKIRNLDGVDEKKLTEILSVLKETKEYYSDKAFVPKRLAFLLMDMEPILWGMLESYSNPVQDQILLAIDKISTAIRDCLSD